MAVSPARHPLLHSVIDGARWKSEDEFAGTIDPDVLEDWLMFLEIAGELDRFRTRLQTSTTSQRDETLTEIGCAFFLKSCCLEIVEWEPEGADGKKGEFLVALPGGRRMFVEVKSPGWEGELLEMGADPQRLEQPKHVNGEAFFFDPEIPIRGAVKKAYPKLLDSMPTLLLVFDDARVPLSAIDDGVIAGLLYASKVVDAPGVVHDGGCFADRTFERLGAIGIINYGPFGNAGELTFALFRNPNALDDVQVPREIFPAKRVYDSNAAR